MNADDRGELCYRDGFIPNPFIGLIGFAPGCYLTYLLFARGIPKMMQAPRPQGNEWWPVIAGLAVFLFCWLGFLGGGLLLMFLQRGATFTTSPCAVQTWNRWLWWEHVHTHRLDGYDAVQVRWCRGNRARVYHYLAVLGATKPDVPINTVFLQHRRDAEAMANEIAERMGWNVAAMPDEAVSPSSGRGQKS